MTKEQRINVYWYLMFELTKWYDEGRIFYKISKPEFVLEFETSPELQDNSTDELIELNLTKSNNKILSSWKLMIEIYYNSRMNALSKAIEECENRPHRNRAEN